MLVLEGPSDLEEASKRIAERLRREIQSAVSSWANWKAINDLFSAGNQFGPALQHLGLGSINVVRGALLRDAISTTFRISDPPGSKNDRRTLCKISGLLEKEVLRDRLIDRSRLLRMGYHEWLVEAEIVRNTQRIALIRDCVPSVWSDENLPKDQELYDLRKSMSSIRHNVLSHIGDDEGQATTMHEVEAFVDKTYQLVHAAEMLFIGSAFSMSSLRKETSEQAESFWDYAQLGFVEAFQRDMNIRTNGNEDTG